MEKIRYLIIALLCTVTTVTQAALSLSGSGTASDPYLIQNKSNWYNFAYNVCDGGNNYNSYSGKYFKLTADINLGSIDENYLVGNDYRNSWEWTKGYFCGNFDGDGHTVTFTYNTSEEYAGLFRYVGGSATIKNLKVKGTITTSAKFAGGIVAYVYPTNSNDKVSLTNCVSEVTINSSVDGDGTHGGLAAHVYKFMNGSKLVITGCRFAGSMTGSSTTNCGGLVGWNAGEVEIKESIFAPAEISISTNGCSTFCRNGATIDNSFYTETLGSEQGLQLHSITTDDKYVTKMENAGTATEYSVSGITGYGVGVKYGGVYYAGKDQEVSLTLEHSDKSGYTFLDFFSSAGRLIGSGTDYTLTMADEDVTISTLWWDGEALEVAVEDELNSAAVDGAYIKLSGDITLNNYFGIESGRNVVLDLNGHTLSRNLSAADNDGHVIWVRTGGTLTVRDSGGGGKLTGGWANNGGGICNYGTLYFIGGTITGCQTDNTGGAIRNNGTATISGGTFTGCSAPYGGCFYNTGTMTITGGTVSSNESTSGGGGAVMNIGTLNITGGSFEANTAKTNGGALWNGNSGDYKGVLTVTGINISGNSAAGNGGAIWNENSTTLTGCTISGNSGNDCGGVYNAEGGTLTINGGTISGNTTSQGGGGVNNHATAYLNNVTITGNTAATDGGGIWQGSSCTMTITGCEITGNSAGSAGSAGNGIFVNEGTFNMQGLCKVDGNSGSGKGNIYMNGSSVITSTGAFLPGSRMGVYLSSVNRKFTSGFSTSNSDAQASDFFYTENGSLYSMTDRDGEAIPGLLYIERAWVGGDTDGHVVATNKYCNNYTVYSRSGTGMTLGSGWYYVNEGTSFSQTIYIKGDTKIIVADDLTFIAYNGIVIQDGATLTVYAQGKETGQFRSAALSMLSNSEAAIGAGSGAIGGNLIVHGGNVYAKASNSNGAGIGGSDGSSSGMRSVTIYGGTVEAYGASSGAGIGCGQNNNTKPTVTIYGGTVKATGGDYAAGIGGSEDTSGGTVKIYGGTVTAQGGQDGAGIGGGEGSSNGTVYIYGGDVTATGGNEGAGIGGGEYHNGGGGGGTVYIYGGTVKATAGKDGSGIGGGKKGAGANVYIYGGTVTAKNVENGWAIGGGYNCDQNGTVTLGDNIQVRGGGTDGDLYSASERVSNLMVSGERTAMECTHESGITYSDKSRDLHHISCGYCNGYDEAHEIEGSLCKLCDHQFPDANRFYVGGIAGEVEGGSVVHCTSNVTIDYGENARVFAGGITGWAQDGTVEDCLADNAISGNIGGRSCFGGVVGGSYGEGSITGCSSTGSIVGKGIYGAGIVGDLTTNVKASACSSSMTIDGAFAVHGGIAGYANGTIDCCVFTGYLKAGDYNSDNTGVGGIVGRGDENNLIQSCVMAGTINNVDNRDNVCAIVGCVTTESNKSVTNCYYDTSLFGGAMLPDRDSHSTVKGLATSQLTTGKATDLNLLTTDTEGDFGLTLNSGYYPVPFVNQAWSGYATLEANDASDANRKLFAYDGINKDNDVFLPAAKLGGVTWGIRSGDVSYDFVSTMSRSDVQVSVTDALTLNCAVSYPEADFLSISDKKATAVSNGEAVVSLLAGISGTWQGDRPKVTSLSARPLYLNVTPYELWDGTVADGYPYGTGTAEDPYIIKRGGQLAYALLNNATGEHFEQLCDITLNEDVHADPFEPTATNEWLGGDKWSTTDDVKWKGRYTGNGHFIKGAYIKTAGYGVFANMETNSSVEDLAIIDSHIENQAGLFAADMDGEIINCIAQGSMGYRVTGNDNFYNGGSGGICAYIGRNNRNALIEDCISAVYTGKYIFTDWGPFASNSERNKGKVTNSLAVVPMIYHERFRGITNGNAEYQENCYWLKGYENSKYGYTLEEINEGLGKRKKWKKVNNYFPTLQTFADTEIGKLLTIPVRTDEEYTYDNESGSDNYLLGFGTQLLFEPGGVSWTCTDNDADFIEWDADMGIIVPVKESPMVMDDNVVSGLQCLTAQLGNYKFQIPVRPSRTNVAAGISFKDDNARDACLAAFDSNNDGTLTLAELKAVTTEQTLDAFQTETARKIVEFPEFRLFKSVSTLTSQLNGMTALEDIKLPYSLQTLGTEAFKDCSNLKHVTIPSKMTTIEGGAFYQSSVDSIYVDPFNETFGSREGVLFASESNTTSDDKTVLAAFPNGRSEISIPGTVTRIAKGAVYKVPGATELYFDTTDFTTVPKLENEGIVSEDGNLMHIYVCDATKDAVLLNAYKKESSWASYKNTNKLDRYYPLKIGSDVTTTDLFDNTVYVGTFYIGFDTKLPVGVTPYVVSMTDRENFKAYLREKASEVPSMTPVVAMSTEPGTYRLKTLDHSVPEWPMHENQLVGVNRYGLRLYQWDSAQGSIMTPQVSSVLGDDPAFGFFYDKSEELAPYTAYLTYNTVDMDATLARFAHYKGKFDLQMEADGFQSGDFTYVILSYKSDGQYVAGVKSYDGEDGIVTVPATVDWEQQEGITVKKMLPGIFADCENDIYCIDMTEMEEVDNVSTSRTAESSPFYGLDERTLVFLPEGVADEAENFILGSFCKKLSLHDGFDFCAPFEFEAEEATYDRVLSATKNDDGSWESKSYTVCLPYDVDLSQEYMDDKVQVLGLFYVMDGNELIFSNVMPTLAAGVPYIIIVNEGEITLSASSEDCLTIIPEPTEGMEVYDWDDEEEVLGYWRGTFRTMSNDECAEENVYSYSTSDGNFRRIRNDAAKYRNAYLNPFRGAFFSAEETGIGTLYTEYVESIAGDNDPQDGLPSDNFVGDTDFTGYDDDPVGISATLNNNVENDNVYDLQGRKLEKPNKKGVYIVNGHKVVMK